MIFSQIFTIITGLTTSLWLFFSSKKYFLPSSNKLNENIQDFNFSCGITHFQARIINGLQTKPYVWPWIVSLRTRNSLFKVFSSHICAGTIINHYIILTAAHCVKDLKAKDLVVIVGIYNLKDSIQESKIFYVNNIIHHSNYILTENDIALIRLAKKIDFSEKIQPICLPPDWMSTKFLLNKTLTLVGWGSTDGMRQSISLANSLQQTSLKEINGDFKCLEYVTFNAEKIICAIDDTLRNSNACFGDSGGPLAIQLDNRWHIVGITSFIISYQNEHCNPQSPSYYTHVNSFNDWINQTVKIL